MNSSNRSLLRPDGQPTAIILGRRCRYLFQFPETDRCGRSRALTQQDFTTEHVRMDLTTVTMTNYDDTFGTFTPLR